MPPQPVENRGPVPAPMRCMCMVGPMRDYFFGDFLEFYLEREESRAVVREREVKAAEQKF